MEPQRLIEAMFEELTSSSPEPVAAKYMSEDMRMVARPGPGGGIAGVLKQLGVEMPGA